MQMGLLLRRGWLNLILMSPFEIGRESHLKTWISAKDWLAFRPCLEPFSQTLPPTPPAPPANVQVQLPDCLWQCQSQAWRNPGYPFLNYLSSPKQINCCMCVCYDRASNRTARCGDYFIYTFLCAHLAPGSLLYTDIYIHFIYLIYTYI